MPSPIARISRPKRDGAEKPGPEIAPQHTLSHIERKLAGVSATLYRSIRMAHRDNETATPDIDVHLYKSAYGGTVVFEVRDTEHERYVLLAGNVLSATTICVLHDPMAEHPLALIGTTDGFSVVSYDDIMDAINTRSDTIRATSIDGYFLMDENYNIPRDREPGKESPVRLNSVMTVAAVQSTTGEIHKFYYDQLESYDEDEQPGLMGVPSLEPEQTFMHVFGYSEPDIRTAYIGEDEEPRADEDFVFTCFPTKYGIHAPMFVNNEEVTFSVERLNAHHLHDLRAHPVTTDEDGIHTGILIHNGSPYASASLATYLHGGPEHYFTTAYDLITSDHALTELVAKHELTYVPFLERSTDFHRTRDFLYNSEKYASFIPFLGEKYDEHERILDSVRVLQKNKLQAGPLYSVSQGGHTALAMLAYCAADRVADAFSTIIMQNALLDVDDPLTSGEFNVHQMATLRQGYDKRHDPLDMLNSDEWHELQRASSHPEVVVVTSADDPICHVETAAHVVDVLADADYCATLFVDEYASGHRLSPGGILYTVAHFH